MLENDCGFALIYYHLVHSGHEATVGIARVIPIHVHSCFRLRRHSGWFGCEWCSNPVCARAQHDLTFVQDTMLYYMNARNNHENSRLRAGAN